MSTVLAKTNDLKHEEWLQERKKGIGGSDAGAIAGFNKWKSPIVVYMEKIGEAPESKVANEEAAHFGNVLEDVVAKEFSRRTGLKVRRRNAVLQHPEHEWMLANVDRLIVGKNEGLECKTASEYLKDEWTSDEVPASYLLQCQHYMAVTGADAWWIAVLIGGNKFVYKKIERDEDLITKLISIEKDFWENHVLKKEPPEIDGSEASEQFINAMYPESEPETETKLPSEADKYLESINAIKEEIKRLETQKKEYENKIKEMIGEHEKAYSSRHLVTWKSVETNRFNSKKFKVDYPDLYSKYVNSSSYRRFTFKEVN